MIALRSNNGLLRKLALAKPGIKISEISEQLGPIMRECGNLEDVLDWGSIKDESFCKDKRLFWFYATTPPCRAIEVYTDPNGIVVYATWRQL